MNQKGIAHILILTLLLIGMGVGIYLLRQQTIFKPGAASSQCIAESVSSFRECVNKVNSNQADVVEVLNMITCQKADNCEFTLANIHRPVHIKGKKGIRAGFKRLDWFETPILRITNSDKVYVSDLVFDDNDRIKCAPYSNFSNPNDPNNKNSCYPQYCAHEKAGCNPTIVVASSNNTYFDNIEVLYSKWIGLAIFDGSGHRVANSLFKGTEDLNPALGGRPDGSGWYGFWTWNNTKQYEFINNRLINQQSNTGIFTSNATIEKRTIVKGNFFQNNGTLDLVRSGGGTIAVIPNFQYGDVIFNEVIDAKAAYNPFERYYTPNGGIEIDVLGHDSLPTGVNVNSQVHHANFMGNVLHGIEGNYGIGIGDKAYYSNVNIGKNVIFDIRALYPNWEAKPIIVYAGDARVYDNCLNNPSCAVPAYSTLTSTPDVCIPGSDGNCNSTVRWSSKSYNDIVVKNRRTGAELGRGANGAAEFNWTNTAGEAVDLYSNGRIIESLVLRNGILHEEFNIQSNGAISAQPASCELIGQNTCSVTINWDLSRYPNPNADIEIRLRDTGALFAAGGIRGSAIAPWINADGIQFDLYADGLPVDSVFVKGAQSNQPPSNLITASPNPCILTPGNICSSEIRLNAGGYSNLQVKIRENGAEFTGQGADPLGSWNAPWITAAGYNFDLYSNGNLIGSVFVKGQGVTSSPSPSPSVVIPKGKLTANPNPCQIAAGQDKCTSKITWNVQNPAPEGVVVKIRSNGQGFAGGTPQGTADAWFINLTPVVLDLYSGSSLLDSLSVSGVIKNSPPVGVFDGVFGSQLIGWTCDSDVFATAPAVHLYIDDIFVLAANADKTGEAAIATHCGGFKDRRFIIDIPNQFKDGKVHSVKVYSLDNITKGTNTLLNGSPKTITIQPQSSSPAISPSPAGKTGDVDGDGDVDIFDFNQFLKDYRENNLRSDFNKNGKVDIFDFNILLQYFGR